MLSAALLVWTLKNHCDCLPFLTAGQSGNGGNRSTGQFAMELGESVEPAGKAWKFYTTAESTLWVDSRWESFLGL